MNSDVQLVVYGVTAGEWSARYGVMPFSHPCSECGRMLTTSIPFAQGTLRGLRAPTCACGYERGPMAIVRDPAYGDLFTGVEASSSKRNTGSVGRVLRLRRRS